jgi:hypothetical protein
MGGTFFRKKLLTKPPPLSFGSFVDDEKPMSKAGDSRLDPREALYSIPSFWRGLTLFLRRLAPGGVAFRATRMSLCPRRHISIRVVHRPPLRRVLVAGCTLRRGFPSLGPRFSWVRRFGPLRGDERAGRRPWSVVSNARRVHATRDGGSVHPRSRRRRLRVFDHPFVGVHARLPPCKRASDVDRSDRAVCADRQAEPATIRRTTVGTGLAHCHARGSVGAVRRGRASR